MLRLLRLALWVLECQASRKSVSQPQYPQSTVPDPSLSKLSPSLLTSLSATNPYRGSHNWIVLEKSSSETPMKTPFPHLWVSVLDMWQGVTGRDKSWHQYPRDISSQSWSLSSGHNKKSQAYVHLHSRSYQVVGNPRKIIMSHLDLELSQCTLCHLEDLFRTVWYI